jgi:hypothetical protein
MGNPLWIHVLWVGLSYRVFIAEKDQVIKDANLLARAGITSLYTDASVALTSSSSHHTQNPQQSILLNRSWLMTSEFSLIITYRKTIIEKHVNLRI